MDSQSLVGGFENNSLIDRLMWTSVIRIFLESVLKLVRENIRKQVPTIIFCNKKASLLFLLHTFEDCNLRDFVTPLFADKTDKIVR